MTISTKDMATLLLFAPSSTTQTFWDEELYGPMPQEAVVNPNVETEAEWLSRNAFLDEPLDASPSDEADLDLNDDEFDSMFGEVPDTSKKLCVPGPWLDRAQRLADQLDRYFRQEFGDAEALIVVESEDDAEEVRRLLNPGMRDAA